MFESNSKSKEANQLPLKEINANNDKSSMHDNSGITPGGDDRLSLLTPFGK